MLGVRGPEGNEGVRVHDCQAGAPNHGDHGTHAGDEIAMVECRSGRPGGILRDGRVDVAVR
jgi:hypothetical protein